MGLEDIDEDITEPINNTKKPSSVPSSTVQGSAHAKPIDMNDLFGGISEPTHYGADGSNGAVNASFREKRDMPTAGLPTSTGSSVQPAQPAAASEPSTAAVDVLDSFFAADVTPPPTSTGDVNRIHVGQDETNIFDTSQPTEYAAYQNSATFLEGFERQMKTSKCARGGSSKQPLLSDLTKNRNDNAIKARLLALMNYYDVLGVAQDTDESHIRQQYKKKALELHPDRVGRAQTSEEQELFKVITTAHEVLSDPVARQKYDEELKGSAGGMASPTSTDWFSHLSPT